METLQDKIIHYLDLYYVIKDVDTRGILKCHKLSDRTVNKFIDIDPLVNYVGVSRASCASRLIIGGSSLANLNYMFTKKITACVAYRNKDEEFLLICGCEDGSYLLYKLANNGNDVYFAEVVNSRVISPKNRIYTEMVQLSGFPVSFNVKMFKLSNELVGVACYNILQGLLSSNDYSTSVDLSFLSTLDTSEEYYLVYLKDIDGKDYIIPAEECPDVLSSLNYSKVSRASVFSYIKSRYDYPCIHFSTEELEKVIGILENYGYPLRPVLEKYDGKISNFYFKSKQFSVGIFDIPETKSYEIRKVVCEGVLSINGDVLYYELRSYPLVGDSYRVLASSLNKDYLINLLSGRYAELLRSSQLHYTGSDYYLKEFKDEENSCKLSCYLYSDPSIVYSGVYDKLSHTWSYGEPIPKGARNFMSRIAGYFANKYGILH